MKLGWVTPGAMRSAVPRVMTAVRPGEFASCAGLRLTTTRPTIFSRREPPVRGPRVTVSPTCLPSSDRVWPPSATSPWNAGGRPSTVTGQISPLRGCTAMIVTGRPSTSPASWPTPANASTSGIFVMRSEPSPAAASSAKLPTSASHATPYRGGSTGGAYVVLGSERYALLSGSIGLTG